MSDSTQGAGWWQASDGKWYPPEQHPDFQAGATQPIGAVPPPTAAMPTVPPLVPPAATGGVPPGAPVAPPPGPPTAGGSSNAKWIIVGVLAVAAAAIAAFLLLGGDNKKNNVAATSSSSSSSSSPSSSSSSSSSTSSSSSSKSSSSSSSSGATAADLQRKMLKAAEVGIDFKDGKFTPDNTTPQACGQPNTATQFPPVLDVGSLAQDTAGTALFQEEVSTYKDAATAAQAFDAGKQGVSCTQGTINDGSAVTFSSPSDVSSDVNTPGAIEIDAQSSNFSAQLIAVRIGNTIVLFQFEAASSVDPSTLPNALTVAKNGLQKLSL
jgi:hypothetical protein